jgi:exosortase
MSLAVPVPRLSERRWEWLLWCAIIAGLLGYLYASILKGLVLQWWSDPDYGHGFFVPLFSGFVLWRQRDRILATEVRPTNFGLLVVLGSLCLFFLGSLGAELFISRISLLILGAGLILFLAGSEVLRVVSFPLTFLICMIPIPAIAYSEITFPLQLLASRLASAWLELVRVPVLRDGNVLVMSNYSLEVVEACSGIRSLVSLIALAVAYGYLAERRYWVRLVLALLMLPGAIVTNGIRIVIAGVCAHRFGPPAAAGVLHEFTGWLVFLTTLILMVSTHSVICLKRKPKVAHA